MGRETGMGVDGTGGGAAVRREARGELPTPHLSIEPDDGRGCIHGPSSDTKLLIHPQSRTARARIGNVDQVHE